MLQKSASELHKWLPFVHNHLILFQLDQTEIQYGTFIHTVIPRLARFLWQQKNRVR